MKAPVVQMSGIRQTLLWSAFSVLLAAGLVFFFRYAGAVRPLVEAVTEK